MISNDPVIVIKFKDRQTHNFWGTVLEKPLHTRYLAGHFVYLDACNSQNKPVNLK